MAMVTVTVVTAIEQSRGNKKAGHPQTMARFIYTKGWHREELTMRQREHHGLGLRQSRARNQDRSANGLKT